jgi:hypothetical protein
MCCLVTIMAFVGPRAALIIWWLTSMTLFDRMFATVFWPVMGVIFAPWTTLMYAIAWWGSTPQGHFVFWGYLIIVIGILLDIMSYGGGAWRNRKRVPGVAA